MGKKGTHFSIVFQFFDCLSRCNLEEVILRRVTGFSALGFSEQTNELKNLDIIKGS